MHTDPPLRMNIGPRFEEIHPRLSLPPSCLPHRHPPFLRVVPCCVDLRVPRGFLQIARETRPEKGVLSDPLAPTESDEGVTRRTRWACLLCSRLFAPSRGAQSASRRGRTHRRGAHEPFFAAQVGRMLEGQRGATRGDCTAGRSGRGSHWHTLRRGFSGLSRERARHAVCSSEGLWSLTDPYLL
jgi:hypothetical protein